MCTKPKLTIVRGDEPQGAVKGQEMERENLLRKKEPMPIPEWIEAAVEEMRME